MALDSIFGMLENRDLRGDLRVKIAGNTGLPRIKKKIYQICKLNFFLIYIFLLSKYVPIDNDDTIKPAPIQVNKSGWS